MKLGRFGNLCKDCVYNWCTDHEPGSQKGRVDVCPNCGGKNIHSKDQALVPWERHYPGTQLLDNIKRHYLLGPNRYERVVILWFNTPYMQFDTKGGKGLDIAPTPSSLKRIAHVLRALWAENRLYIEPFVAGGLEFPEQPGVKFLILEIDY